MGWFSKNKDFISPKEEQKESIGSSVRELLDGRILADKVIRKNLFFILFLTILGIFYIYNGYQTEKLYREKIKIERRVRELRFESVTSNSSLMHMSKPSEVKKKINQQGLELEESTEPPFKLYRR